MARTAVAVSTLTANALTADPAGTNVDPTNGHVVTLAQPLEEMVLRVHNTAAADHTITIKAGTYPPALDEGQGDLTLTIPTATTQWVGPLTSARFMQDGSELFVDIQAGFTGTITAFAVPRNA